MRKPETLHPDVLVGTALLALCAAVYWNTTTFPEVPAMLSQNVPPTFFPRLLLFVIAVLSLGLVASAWKRRREPGRKLRAPVLVTAAILVLAVALVPRLGTLVTIFLVSIVLPLYWGERRVARIALLAVTLPLAIHLLFALGLGMRFPPGLLY